MLGEIVYVKQLTIDNEQLTIDATKFRQGIYFVRVALDGAIVQSTNFSLLLL